MLGMNSSRVHFWIYTSILLSVSALIWFLGPQISIHGKFVLASALNRIACIALMIVLAEIIRIKPHNLSQTSSLDSKVRAELSLLRNSLAGALKFMRKTKLSIDDRKAKLYQLPWHLLIGPPESGKSALMANSGCKFILAKKNSGKSSKGTRHIDWWITREAVILDTSGHFTIQGGQSNHKKLWFTLLNWLSRHGRGQLESILVVLSLGDLIQKSAAEQKKIFEDIHMRLVECQRLLKRGFTVHIVLTKCDLLAGFNSYFETLDSNEREQLWGIVLPAQFQKPMQQHVQAATAAFLHKLQERVIWRMHHERNLQKRAQIKEFPLQIEKALPIILELIQHILPLCDEKGNAAKEFHLSGIFFTSTSQKEAAFDQLLAPLTEGFALAPYREQIIINPELTYFTKQLFFDVIFDGAKVSQWKKQAAFQQGLRYGMYAAATVVIISSTIILVQSFHSQLNQIDRAKQAITEYQLLAKQAQNDPSLKSLLTALDALDRAQLAIAETPRKIIKDINSEHRNLPALIQQSYDKTVVSTIIPKLKADVEAQLRHMLNDRNTDHNNEHIGYFYKTLTIYQMLHKPEHVNVEVIGHWLAQFWDENHIGDQKQLSQLKPHIANAFVKLDRPIAINQHLVEQSKDFLQRLSPSELAQAILDDLTQMSLQSELPLPITATESDKSIFYGPVTSIPYLYTQPGFYQGFAAHYQQAAEQAVMGNWVLGNKLSTQSAREKISQVENSLAEDYAQHYVAQWHAVLDKTRFTRFHSFNQAKRALMHLPQGLSDLSKLLHLIQVHTQFAQLNEPTPAIRTAARYIEQSFRTMNERLGYHPEQNVEATLSQLQLALVSMTKTTDELDASLQFSKAQFQSAQPLMQQIHDSIDELPQPMQSWFQAFTHDFWNKVLSNSAQSIQQQWQTLVWDEFQKHIAGHYPIAKNGHQDLSVEEFSQFYGPSGRIQHFLNSYIAPFATTGERRFGRNWKSLADQRLPLSDNILKVSEQLENIHAQLFQGAKQQIEVNFSLIANALSPTIKGFTLKLDGHTIEYPNGTTSLGNVRWPNPLALQHEVIVSMKTDQHPNKQLKQSGSWALFKFLKQAKLEATKDPKRFVLTIKMDKHAVKYDLIAANANNPFSQKIFDQLTLPKEI